MPLTNDEIFQNISNLFGDLADAVKQDSYGGATITKDEIVNIVTSNLTAIGIDVVD